jgi:prophage antirepressor-like protein
MSEKQTELKKEISAKPKIFSDIINYDFQGNPVRAMTDSDGDPWFVAVDVCTILDLGNPTNAVRPLDDDEKSTLKSLKGTKLNIKNSAGLNIVSFPGLNRLVMKSYKPEAKPFQRWVAHEVLMQIYKTGAYIPEGHQTTGFETVSNEFNEVAAHLIAKSYTTVSAMQMANSAVNKIFNVDYLGSFTLPNAVLKSISMPYQGRLLTPQEIGDEVDMNWKKVQSLMLANNYIEYTDRGEMMPTPQAEEHAVFLNQLSTHQRKAITKVYAFWWKESIIDVVEGLIEKACPKQPAGSLEWWKFDALMTASDIAAAMNLHTEKINLLLLKLGFQEKNLATGRYVPTAKGKPYAQKSTLADTGPRYWKNTILPVLSEILHTKHPGGWGEPMLADYYRKAPKFHEAKRPKTKKDYKK